MQFKEKKKKEKWANYFPNKRVGECFGCCWFPAGSSSTGWRMRWNSFLLINTSCKSVSFPCSLRLSQIHCDAAQSTPHKALTKAACTLVDLGLGAFVAKVCDLTRSLYSTAAYTQTHVLPTETEKVDTLKKNRLPPRCRCSICKHSFMPFSIRWWTNTPRNTHAYTSSLCPSAAFHNANGLGTLKAWSNKHNAGPHGVWVSRLWVVSWMDLCVCVFVKELGFVKALHTLSFQKRPCFNMVL